MSSANESSLLRVDLGGLELRNPVVLAAGTAGTLDELNDVMDLSGVGGLVTKSITPEPRGGNKPWRVAPLAAGMLNAVGLANIGIEAFVRDVAPRIGGMPTKVIGSIAGFSIDDYVRVAGAFDAIDALGAVELNVSCPNVHGGCEFGADPALLGELVRAVRQTLTRTRLFVKLAPAAVARPGIVELAKSAIEPAGSSPAGPNQRPGADALSLCNTMPAMAVDVRTRRPRLGNVTGGFSGPGVHPVAVRLVHEVYRGVARDSRTPLIGVGGVFTWEDAAEFVLVGASAVQMGTALFADPRSPQRVARGLAQWVRDQHAASIRDLVGKVEIS